MFTRAIDARVFGIRAIVGALVATGCTALIASQSYAQQPRNTRPSQTQIVEFGSGQLRPVREVTAARTQSRETASIAPRSAINETLRWRQSPDLKPQAHHLPKQDVFADDAPRSAPAKRRASRDTVPNRMRDVRTAQYHQNDYRSQPVASQPASHVQQAAWSQEAQEILDEAISHNPKPVQAKTIGAKQDFFGNPFGEPNPSSTSPRANESGTTLRAPANQQFNDFRSDQPAMALSAPSAEIHQAQARLANQFEMLPPAADDIPNSGAAASQEPSTSGMVNPFREESGSAIELPSPNASAPDALPAPAKTPAPIVEQAPPYKGLFNETPNASSAPQARDTPQADAQSNLFESLDAGEEAMPAPNADPSELRDLLKSVDPNEANKDDSLENLPSPRKDGEARDRLDSPSDREEMFSNPFPKRNSQADQDDRDRLQDRMDELKKGNRSSADTKTLDDEQESDRSKDKIADGLSCNEFRQRISRETIRTLSLDISAPFRPDVFDVEEYEELKQKFEAAQPVRPWTSMTGNVIASGRLRDLAYEKAIVETDEGTIQEIQINDLSEGDLAYISQNWGLPKECRLEQVAYTPRNWQRHVMTWKASNLCHKPLYFEEVNLERYGHTAGPILQPVVSSAHFFANIAVMPYKMGIHPPSECQYALGYYRPGNCAPWIVPPVPLSLRGAAAQVAAVSTGFLLIP